MTTTTTAAPTPAVIEFPKGTTYTAKGTVFIVDGVAGRMRRIRPAADPNYRHSHLSWANVSRLIALTAQR